LVRSNKPKYGKCTLDSRLVSPGPNLAAQCGMVKDVYEPGRPCAVFISYSRRDIEVARKVEAALKKAEHKVWRDERDLEPLDNWSRKIASGLANSDVIVLLWSAPASRSRWVRSEWCTARALGKGIVPCLLQPVRTLAATEQLPDELFNVQTLSLDGQRLETDLKKLVELVQPPDRAYRDWDYTRVPEHSVLKFPHNTGFVGRKGELLELYLLLVGEANPVGINQTVGAFGLGGIGKTQLAAEFALRFSYAFPKGVIWINGAASWREEFLSAARQLGLTVENPTSPNADQRLLDRFRSYLAESRSLLLVMDNVSNPDDIASDSRLGFNIATLGCSLLFTTRCQDLPPFARQLRVDALPERYALALLGNPVRLSGDEERAAEEICRKLGYLPLALEMAASYLRENRETITFECYLENLKERIKVLENYKGLRKLATHSAAIEATFHSQCELVKNPAARELFEIAGQFQEAAVIPEARLSLLSGVRNPAKGLDRPFTRALQDLYRFSLAERLANDSLRLHPLVWEFSRGLLPNDERQNLRVRCAKRLRTAYRDLTLLATEYQRRGIESLIDDLRISVDWSTGSRGDLAKLADYVAVEGVDLLVAGRRFEPNSFLSKSDCHGELLALLAVLKKELPSLKFPNESTPRPPLSFLQQLLCRSHDLGLAELSRRVADALRSSRCPSLVPLGDCQQRHQSLRSGKDQRQAVTAVCMSPDGGLALVGSWDGSLTLWDAARGRLLRKLDDHSAPVRAIAFSPDGRLALCGLGDGTLSLWDTARARRLRALKHHSSSVTAVAFAPDGKCALSGSVDRTVVLWNATSRRRIRTFTDHPEPILAVGFCRDGRHVVSGSRDDSLVLWNIATGEPDFTCRVRARGFAFGFFEPDRPHLIDFWDNESLKQLEGIEGSQLAKSVVSLGGSASFSSDSSQALITLGGAEMVLWDVERRRQVHVFKRYYSLLDAVSFSPDGAWALLSYLDIPILFDVASCAPPRILGEPPRDVGAVTFTDDAGPRHTAPRSCTLVLTDLAKPNLKTVAARANRVFGTGFSPDGRHAVDSAVGSGLTFWDTATGESQLRLQTVASAHRLAWGGDRIVIGDTEGRVGFFEVNGL